VIKIAINILKLG